MNIKSQMTWGSLCFVASVAVSSSAFAAEYLVKYRSAQTVMSANSSLTQLEVLDHNEAAQLLKVNLPDNQVVSELVTMSADPNIEYMVPNFQLHAFLAPATNLKTQWAISKIQAQKAWTRAGNQGSRKVLVAVIDTGADYRHKNLAPNMVPGYDFVKNTNDPMDLTSSRNPGHGTHCSGVIGATGLVSGGTTGISPDVSIMPIRFLNEKGSGDLMDGIKAIDYAIEKKVDVISASWGAHVERSVAQPLIEAVQRAEKAGIVFVVAASNDGTNNDGSEVYPANAGTSNAISVAASSSNDSRPRWSNFGQRTVDIAAPGDGIVSTLPGDKYGNLSGTSMATPLVAGLVALIKAQDPNLNPVEIKSLLQASGAKVGILTACNCRIDAFQAIDMIKSEKLFVSPNATTMALGDKLNFSGVYGTKPYRYAVSDSSLAQIDSNGVLTALKNGVVTVKVMDAKDQSAQSLNIILGNGKGPAGSNPAPAPGVKCPWGPKKVCEVACSYKPDLSFCKK